MPLERSTVAVPLGHPNVLPAAVAWSGFQNAEQASFTVAAVGHDTFRITFLPSGARSQSQSWFIADPELPPSATNRDGCDRDALLHRLQQAAGSSPAAGVALQLEPREADAPLHWTLHAGPTSVTALQRPDASPSPLRLAFVRNGHTLLTDFQAGAYTFNGADLHTGAVNHYIQQQAGDYLYGLGEAAGTLERSLQRFRIQAIDAMGYSCDPTLGRVSDPLYKHFPILYTLCTDPGTGAVRGAYALVYDAPGRGVIDTGNEISAFRGPYRYASFEGGDLEYYAVFGDGTACHPPAAMNSGWPQRAG
jgi:hypothetical protein